MSETKTLMSNGRLSIYAIPNRPMCCVLPARNCVYRQNGICDQPRINKGNSDAACHKMSNKALLKELCDG